MGSVYPVTIGSEALADLTQYCAAGGLKRLLLVADAQTYPVWGEKVEAHLGQAGCLVKRVVLRFPEVVAGSAEILQVLLSIDGTEDALLAVGSGTITDIARFVAHRIRRPFISLPTAPSVDGYMSSGAPLVVEGFKQTVPARPPVALFADLDTLRAAPRPMIAAGFGDMLGKFTSLADWQLGHLVWGEVYDAEIARRTRLALNDCLSAMAEIRTASDDGVRRLMAGLVDSGICMLDFGRSHPASGSEHHLSHFWEMRLLQEGRPAVLHGAKVGLAALLSAGLYAQVRQLNRAEVQRRLSEAQLPDLAAEEANIRQLFGPAAEAVLADHRSYLAMSPEAFRKICQNVGENWDEILRIAASVPEPGFLKDCLEQTGGVTRPEQLGLGQDEVTQALNGAHYLRCRFTILKLARLLAL